MRNIAKTQRAMAGVGKSSILPAGAIPCESIFSTGYGEFFETGITPGKYTSFEADWTRIFKSETLFGYYQSTRFTPVRVINQPGQCELGYNNYYGYKNYGTVMPPLMERVKTKVSITPTNSVIQIFDKDGNLYDSGTASYNETSYTPNHTIGIFSRKTSNTGIEQGGFRGMLHELKMYDDSEFGHLQAHYIPCYYDGGFKLYEAVSKSFISPTVPSGYMVYGTGEYWDTQGFIANRRNSAGRSPIHTIDNRWTLLTRLFEVPQGCTKIRFSSTNISDRLEQALMFLTASLANAGHASANNTAPVEVNVPSNAKYVRMHMSTANGGQYIYDMTHEQYIWQRLI